VTAPTAEPIFVSLASGSRGNSAYLGTRDAGILIDAGISLRQIKRRLAVCGIDLSAVQGVFVTHEHGDHIHGLSVLHKHHSVPIIATPGTLVQLKRRCGCDGQPIEPNTEFIFNDWRVLAVPVPHDACQPVCFRFDLPRSLGGVSIGFVTDIGNPAPWVIESMRGVDFLYLEANHDADMLAKGPYPKQLKERVASRRGHASNEQTKQFLAGFGLFLPPLIMLGHLSETNNTPELATAAVDEVVAGRSTVCCAQQNNPQRITIATQVGMEAVL